MSDFDQTSLDVINKWEYAEYGCHAQGKAILQELISEAISLEVKKSKVEISENSHRKLEQFKDY